ncbi:proton-coupled folate transporter-like [Haliotis cracherodii]|uniref:proton-coupled folate transporter-like n=1 Tax=Haliotis cracherodii TaxID=6455 RepID=UPI0039E7CDC7
MSQGEEQTTPVQGLTRKLFQCVDFIQGYFVDAALFCFFLSRHMSLPLFQEYVQDQIHKKHNLNLIDIQKGMSGNETSSWHEAQQESVLAVLGLQIAEGLPAIITVLILGAVSDRTGRRKILLWLPSLGSVAHSLIYVLILYTGWNLDGLFMASALRGISGSMTAFLAGSTYFAINSVKPNQRASRLAIQEFLNGGAYALGNIMVGFWVKSSGFLQPFWFTLICGVIAFLISFFLVQECPLSEADRPVRHRRTGNCCKDLFAPMAKIFNCCKNRGLIKVWMAILAFQTYAAVHIGQENVLVLYLSGQPYLYSWRTDVTGPGPYVKIGLFLSVIMAVAAAAVALSPPIMRRFLTESNIAFIGYFSKALGTLWIAVVHNETILYFAILLLAFELLPFPMMRSIVSRGISPSEQGSLFAVMHCGESIIYFLAPFTFTAIYASSLHYFGGFVFIVSIILLCLPTGFTIALRYLESREPQGYEPMDGADLQPEEEGPSAAPSESETDRLAQEPISFIQLSQDA